MTQWVENPDGGRARGPRAVVRAWAEVLIRPVRFFRVGVAPGDQAPGFTFSVAVGFVAAATHFALVPAARPSMGGRPFLSVVLVVGLIAVVVAPLVLHLAAALQTLLLVLFASERAGVSETVQVLAYAAAPGALAGLPVPGLAALCGCYGYALLALGLREVHGVSLPRALALGALPAALVFGVALRGFADAAALIAMAS